MRWRRRSAAALRRALAVAERSLARFPTWGDMHRLELNGLLARAPLIGRAFRHASLPVSGSRETAHGFVDGRHGASYGSQEAPGV